MKDLKIIDIKKTPRKDVINKLMRNLKIKYAKPDLLHGETIGVFLDYYINPKANPFKVKTQSMMSKNMVKDISPKKLGAHLILDNIEDLLEGHKAHIPVKTIIDDLEESKDGKTYMPIWHSIYINVKIRDKNLIGLEK